METRIWSDIDLAGEGKQIGRLYLPYSVTRSAYGHITIPIAVIAKGAGPTVLLTGGNHGDEYEGQIALIRMIQELGADDVRGRVIIIPALNFPAAAAGTRVSPLDGGNLNRAFPGNPDGGPTAQIAHYVDSVLLPGADLWIDLHSGGSSLDYLPFAALYVAKDDAETMVRGKAILQAFGAPRLAHITAPLDRSFAAASAQRRRVPYIGGEWGGGGSVSIDGARLAREGIYRALAHLGVIRDLARFNVLPAEASAFFELADRPSYVHSTHTGVFAPVVKLGDHVDEGALLGHVLFPDDPARLPVAFHFVRAGIVMCMHHSGRVEPGDCLAHTMTRLDLN